MNTFTSDKRNIGIDVLKYLCAFMVICLHTSFRGKTTVDALARVAVPLFFLISGYYYTRLKEQKRVLSQLKKILILTLISNVCFFILDVVTALISFGSVSSVFTPWTKTSTLIKFIFLNERYGWSHLWYLGALLYALSIFILIDKTGKREKVYYFIPILLCANLALGNYSTLLFSQTVPIAFSRNFLLMGLPFLMLGDFIYKYRNKMKIGNKTLFILLILSIIATQIERFILTHFNAYQNKDFFISTGFLAATLFLLANNNPAWFCSGILSKIGTLGKNVSLSIYILHPMIVMLCTQIIELIGKVYPIAHTVFFYLSPIMILLLSTGIGWLLWYLIKKIKKHP